MQHSDINTFMFAHDFSPYFRPNYFYFQILQNESVKQNQNVRRHGEYRDNVIRTASHYTPATPDIKHKRHDTRKLKQGHAPAASAGHPQKEQTRTKTATGQRSKQ